MKTTLAAAAIILGATITAGCSDSGVSVTASAATGSRRRPRRSAASTS